VVNETGLVQWTGRQAVITLPEQFDVSNAGQIREALLSAVNRGADPLIADMSATICCHHAAAGVITRAGQRAVLGGTELRLVVPAQIMRRVLGISGVDRLVAIYPSLESATAARAPAVALARPGAPADGRVPDSAGAPDGVPAGDLAVFRQVIDAFEDGVALADDRGTITLASVGLGAMFGYQHGEVTGHPVEFLLPSDRQDRPPGVLASYGHTPGTPPAGGARLTGLRQGGDHLPRRGQLQPGPGLSGPAHVHGEPRRHQDPAAGRARRTHRSHGIREQGTNGCDIRPCGTYSRHDTAAGDRDQGPAQQHAPLTPEQAQRLRNAADAASGVSSPPPHRPVPASSGCGRPTLPGPLTSGPYEAKLRHVAVFSSSPRYARAWLAK
jgi:PAS domain S-box-containing protein